VALVVGISTSWRSAAIGPAEGIEDRFWPVSEICGL